jgi:hypothetical protein
MILSVLNHATTDLTDEDVQLALRAINRQLAEDFEPEWSMGAQLRLEGKSQKTPSKTSLPDLRGDAILYLWDGSDVDDALGYHDLNFRGVPYGFVFTKLAKALDEDWTVTLSHEALEMAADPNVNLLVHGPHPTKSSQSVFYWYETCDAVQSESYPIDGIAVSNFLLPLYFTAGAEPGSRNDFLNRVPLSSFGINPGGYVGYYDPETGQHEIATRPDDAGLAQKRLRIKQRYGQGRRAARYQALPVRRRPERAPS